LIDDDGSDDELRITGRFVVILVAALVVVVVVKPRAESTDNDAATRRPTT
jgi:hypothetical protein